MTRKSSTVKNENIVKYMHWPLGSPMIDLLMYRKQPGCGLMRWNYG